MAQLVKTVSGLAIAGVKVVAGLAIASVKTVDGLDNTGGGGGNNITFVTGQKVSNITTGGASVAMVMPGNVTSGNIIMIGSGLFDGIGTAFAIGQITKTAGTATIGTVVLDKAVNPTVGLSGCAIFQVPITGTGSLTLTFTPGVAVVAGYIFGGAAEFTGQNASPSDTDGNSSGTNATTNPEGSGTITTTTQGLLFYAAVEDSTGDSTHTLSDQSVANYVTGSTQITGVVQYRINNTTTPTNMTSAWGQAVAWRSVWSAVKTS